MPVIDKSQHTICIIGGGIAGCSAAVKLADEGYKVILLESRSSLLAGSSDDTPCRLGLGFHYPDLKTAIRYLQDTINFVRTYKDVVPDLRVGIDNIKDQLLSPLCRGRYFITQNSLFEEEEIFAVYRKLKEEYARLVSLDPANAVFGPPEKFYTRLAVSAYADVVNLDEVYLAIETAEQTLNWPAFKAYLINRISQHPNIDVRYNAEVTKIVPDDHQLNKFSVHYKNATNLNSLPSTADAVLDDEIAAVEANITINSAWNNIDAINKESGIPVDLNSRTHRVKVIIEVQLPESLKNANSMFFCFGPHCSLTNVDNGKGWLTYEPVTNIHSSNELLLPSELERLVQGLATPEEKEDYGKKILAGAEQYIPLLKDAKSLNAKFGVVITPGSNADITSKESPIHIRNELGIRVHGYGSIDFPSMKLLFCLEGRDVVYELVVNHINAVALLQEMVQELSTEADHNYLKTVVMQLIQLTKDMLPEYNESTKQVVNQVADVAKAKKELMTAIEIKRQSAKAAAAVAVAKSAFFQSAAGVAAYTASTLPQSGL